MTHFAHDLGPDFHPYFGKTLELLVSLTSSSNAEIIEWSFNCLAYLFKFLSRLLVTDLRPTYSALSILLGKQHQKEFVNRFAAESLAFLLRKCTGPGLELIITHIVNDATESKSEEFLNAVVLLFSECMKSTGTILHSRSKSILECIFTVSASSNDLLISGRLAAGVLAELLHHTQKEDALVLYDVTTSTVNSITKESLSEMQLYFCLMLLINLAALRKGSRVMDWNILFESSTALLHKMDQNEQNEVNIMMLCTLSSALLSYSDFASKSKHYNRYMKGLYNVLQKRFIVFLNYFFQQDPISFANLASSYFQQYVQEYTGQQDEAVGYLMVSLSQYPYSALDKAKLSLGLQSNYVKELFASLNKDLKSLPRKSDVSLEAIAWKLSVARTVTVDPEFGSLCIDTIMRWNGNDVKAGLTAHIFGELAFIIASFPKKIAEVGYDLIDRLLEVLKKLPSILLLNGIEKTVDSINLSKSKNLDEKITTSIMDLLPLLRMPSHSFRQSAVSIINKLYKSNEAYDSGVANELNTCWIIESFPRDVASARNVQMHIRNLASKFKTMGNNAVLDKVIASYLYGLSADRFQPIWQASLDALESLSSKIFVDLWELVHASLELRGLVIPVKLQDTVISGTETIDAFSTCSNVNRMINAVEEMFQKYDSPQNSLVMLVQPEDDYALDHTTERQLGLKVLLRIPKMGEKYSSCLVPHILWQPADEEEEEETQDSWSFKDRVTLLEVFSNFSKPETLLHTDLVYERYLYFLANRTASIQKIALKCVFTYKNPILKKYSESLNALLDDTQFKDEVSQLLTPSDNEGTIHTEDRGTVLPFVIRILFGRAQVAKSGGVKQGRRFAVLTGIHSLEKPYLELFSQLMVDRLDCAAFTNTGKSVVAADTKSFLPSSDPVQFESSLRRQLGFVTFLEELVGVFGARVRDCLDTLMNALLFSLWQSQKISELDAVEISTIAAQNVKSIRTIGIKCLSSIFENLATDDWTSYYQIIYDILVRPRIDSFDKENLQQPSALMNLFKTMSGIMSLVGFFTMNKCVISDKLFGCLTHEGVKDSVVECVLDCMLNILELEEKCDKDVFEAVLNSAVSKILPSVPSLLRRPPNSKILEKESQILVVLLNKGYDLDEITQKGLIEASIDALKQPSNHVRITVKTAILEAFSKLVKYQSFDLNSAKASSESLAPLFKQLSDRNARQNLALVFNSLGEKFDLYSRVSGLLVELNSFSKRRLDLPDFDRRLAAFSTLNEEIWSVLSAEEWLPLLYNMLFFIRDPEELALRTNAVYSVKQFINCKVKINDVKFKTMMEEVLMKEIRLGVRDKSEIFRVEYVEIMQHIVEKAAYKEVEDMECLLMDDDEEANFFNNICHIQIHRRRRAVRRLAGLAAQCRLADTSIAYYLLPLLEHYVAGKEGDLHNLADDSIKTISSLARHLSWNQYRAVLKRYVSYLNKREESVKICIRLITTMADSVAIADDELAADRKSLSETGVPKAVILRDTMPKEEKLENFILNDLSPALSKNLEKHADDDDINLRIPVAIPLIKFMKLLSRETLELKLPGALSKVAQVLRSKAQDVRDTVRNTLGRISHVLGPEYLVFIIRELKSALRRGAQLHVLGYTVHSLLSEYGDSLDAGTLDESSKIVSEVIMEDIFGVTGEEKDEEGYISKMREVKQQKSYDTGQLLAKNITLEKFSNLIFPIKTMLLYEKLSHATERKVEELLRRYSLGLFFNQEAASPSVLVMCFEINNMVKGAELEHQKQLEMEEEKSGYHSVKEYQAKESEEFFTVKLDSRHWDSRKARLHPENLHTLSKFVLDTLRAVFGKSEGLLTVQHVTGFLPIISSALTSNFEDVEIAALRLLSLIIKLPFSDIESDLGFFGRRSIEFIRSSTNTNSEICQASLRLLAVMIRQKPDFSIKESSLSYILSRIQPDLEEPDRQGITFTFLKAVLSRKIVINEIYDVMDHVAKVMVTNQSHVTREACRSAYFAFLTDYPQGSNRLSAQMSFLVANLEYPAQSGRQSVIEMMHLLVIKVDYDQIKNFLTSFFVGLVLTLVNDDSSQCREAAATVLKEIISKAGKEELSAIESFCLSWLSETGPLGQGGLSVAGLYFTELGLRRNPRLYKASSDRIISILETGKSSNEDQSDWKLIYAALQLFEKFTKIDKSGAVTSEFTTVWDLIHENILYPHSWVRLIASRLIGSLYSRYGSSACAVVLSDDVLQQHASRFIRQLGAPEVGEALATQIVKNLIFIIQRWISGESTFSESKEVEEEVEEGEGSENPDGLSWLVGKASAILRTQKRPKEMKASKKACSQLLAALVQLSDKDIVKPLAEKLIMAFYFYSITDDERDKELHDMAREALNMIQSKIGVTDFAHAYSNVKVAISNRQQERRAKRAIEAVAEPELHARKVMRKNLAKKEKRRHNKDENGYYHAKKKKTV